MITNDLNQENQKVVLITGGGKGIGKGIALAFARLGARVAIGCNANPGMAEETLTLLRQQTEAILIPADIGDPEQCSRLVQETTKTFGALDVLVCNAAIQTQHSLLESNVDTLNYVLRVNLRSALQLMNEARPWLARSGAGRIILISSVHGKRATDFDAAYAISKGGMEMLCREAAIAYGKDGITVNIIAPGGVKIEGKTGNPKSFSTRVIPNRRKPARYPLGRAGLPSDAAAVACFLAGTSAEHITGTTIRVDGGLVLL